MNCVELIGRLTRDPETRYTATGVAVCSFSIAINEGKDKHDEPIVNYPKITTFGERAENCDMYLHKGSQVGIKGSLKTGSYKNKHDENVFTMVVNASSVEFLDHKEKTTTEDFQPEGFTAIDEDIPF